MYSIRLQTASGGTDIDVGEHLTARLRDLDPEPVLLVDANVRRLHPGLFEGFRTLEVPAGERHKTLETVEKLYRELMQMDTDRSALLVGVGGGLTTDVAGFVATTYLRGVPFGFVSTTLLGQVDASIGGKNGVNLEGYKNMIGSFRQPGFIWCDLSLLQTLEQREYVSGIAEVIKYGAIRDARFMEYLAEHMEALLQQDPGVLEKVVTTSAGIKADVVQQDETESNLRRILNFGHTVGHALERETKVWHGEAVATGMVFAAGLSHALGLLSTGEVEQLRGVILSAGLPVDLQADPDHLFENLRKDKKKEGEVIHFVLLEGLGRAVVKPIPLKDLKIMLHDLH